MPVKVSKPSENARVQTFYGRFTHEAAKELKNKEDQNEAFKKADGALKKAIELAPDYMISSYYRGFLAKDMKDFGLAKNMFEQVLALDTSFTAARIQYAIALGRNEMHTEAIEEYNILMQNGNRDYMIINNVAFSHYKVGNFKQAEKYYLEAHDLKPDDQQVISNLIRVYRDGLKDIETALKFNDKLRKLKG